MGRSKRRRARLLGSHQKSWIWGRHAVLEALEAGRWRVVELLLSDSLPPQNVEGAAALAARWNAPVRVVSAERLLELCHTREHQGYLARMAEFPYSDAADVLPPRSPDALYAVLDRIQDPQNLGAIVRSAEVFGLAAVFIGAHEQTGVTAAVVRASAGAVTRLPIVQVRSMAGLGRELRASGVALVGASEKAETPLREYRFDGPTAVLIGSEAVGIRSTLLSQCDAVVRIPQRGHIRSLNASVAAGILFYEARRSLGGDRAR